MNAIRERRITRQSAAQYRSAPVQEQGNRTTAKTQHFLSTRHHEPTRVNRTAGRAYPIAVTLHRVTYERVRPRHARRGYRRTNPPFLASDPSIGRPPILLAPPLLG